MYSDKNNINILTATLAHYGVSHAVVCPGSRNAPITHNLHECPAITCHAVTDERSAGFYAMGISLATGLKPVVVCVTSGSALLNLAPAVAEAYYQHVPLVVVSADRPERWIDQLDGQTLRQPGAFGTMVSRCVQLPEPHDEEECWHCNRLVCEALNAATWRTAAPVHINVPVGEPLFSFGTETLPAVRTFRSTRPFSISPDTGLLPEALLKSRKTMVVAGQTYPGTVTEDTVRRLSGHAAVLREALGGPPAHFDEVLAAKSGDRQLSPDYIVYVGDTIVSKRTRQFLRDTGAPTAIITTDSRKTPDPTMHLTDIIECPDNEGINNLLAALAEAREKDESETDDEAKRNMTEARRAFAKTWNTALAEAESKAENFVPPYSQMAAVRYFEQQLDDMEYDWHVHYANSASVRLANIYARHHIWCNRGVNGIEGSLSTAAGFSLATNDVVFCVTGDLSFFYDQNALWNKDLRGNLRIILLNNSGGGIFRCVKGLADSPAPMDLVSGTHNTEARGICTQNDIGYIAARDTDEMMQGIVQLLTIETRRPVALEIFTDSETDAKAMRLYLSPK